MFLNFAFKVRLFFSLLVLHVKNVQTTNVISLMSHQGSLVFSSGYLLSDLTRLPSSGNYNSDNHQRRITAHLYLCIQQMFLSRASYKEEQKQFVTKLNIQCQVLECDFVQWQGERVRDSAENVRFVMICYVCKNVQMQYYNKNDQIKIHMHSCHVQVNLSVSRTCPTLS